MISSGSFLNLIDTCSERILEAFCYRLLDFALITIISILYNDVAFNSVSMTGKEVTGTAGDINERILSLIRTYHSLELFSLIYHQLFPYTALGY